MRRSRRASIALVALLAMLLVMGCERVDLIRDIAFPDKVEAEQQAADAARDRAEFEKKKAEEEAKKAEQEALAAQTGEDADAGDGLPAAPNDTGEAVQGVYALTFSGYEKFPTGVFPVVNSVPGKLTASAFTAYSRRSPRANWTETWRIDAKRSGDEATGPVKFVRHYLADKGTGAKKWTTVVWRGTLEASIADDGFLSGAVNGESIDGDGGVHPLKWTVKGVRSK